MSSLLNLLLLSVPLLHVPHEQALTQEFLCTTGGLDVQKGIVGIFNHALPKCTNPKLDHGSVVQDLDMRRYRVLRIQRCPFVWLCAFLSAYLYGWVSVLDVVLQVAH